MEGTARLEFELRRALDAREAPVVELREIVRAHVEDGGVSPDQAYGLLSSMYERTSDERDEDMLITLLDYLAGFCPPWLAIAGGVAGRGDARRARPA